MTLEKILLQTQHFFGFYVLSFTILHAKAQSRIFAYPELPIEEEELLKR